MVSRGKYTTVGVVLGGWTAGTQTEHFRIKSKGLPSALLPSVITNISILAFSSIVLSFIHLFLMNKTEFLHADSGQFLHPAT